MTCHGRFRIALIVLAALAIAHAQVVVPPEHPAATIAHALGGTAIPCPYSDHLDEFPVCFTVPTDGAAAAVEAAATALGHTLTEPFTLFAGDLHAILTTDTLVPFRVQLINLGPTTLVTIRHLEDIE